MSQKPDIRLVNITLLNFLTRIIFYGFVFVAGWYTARMVSKETFGQLQFVTFVTGLSWTFISFGVPNILSRYITRSVIAGSWSSVLVLLRYASWSFLVTIVAVCTGYVFFFSTKDLAIPVELIIVFTITQFLANYFQVLIQSVYRYKTAFIITAIAVLSGGLFLYITLPSLDIVSYLYTFIGVNTILISGYGISFIRALKRSDTIQTEFSLPPGKELVRMSLYFAVSAILAGVLWQRTEFYLLEKWFSFSDIAVYSVAFTIIALFFEPLKLLTGTLTYYYAGIQDHAKGEAQFTMFFKHFCWLVIFTGAFVWFNADAIVLCVYTDRYADAAAYLRLLTIGMTPGVCSYVLMNMHIGMGRSRFLLIQDLICAMLFCVLVFAGTKWMGLAGTAIAKSVTIMISVAIGLAYTMKRIHFSIPWKLPLTSVVLSICLGYLFQTLPDDSVWWLLLKFAGMFGMYILISFLSRMIDRSLYVKMKEELFKLLGLSG